jgi:hypothetical protein
MAGAVSLRTLARRASAEREAELEHCELCGAPIPEQHSHVLELATRDVKCACRPCALLFERTEKLRLIPSGVYRVDDLELDWEALRLPVDIAFFFRADGRMRAYYPSPMGPTESLLTVDVPVELEDDVQALLVNRSRGARQQWIVPIDECYALVGLIRTRWRGFTGGTEVWEELRRFWDRLERRAR